MLLLCSEKNDHKWAVNVISEQNVKKTHWLFQNDMTMVKLLLDYDYIHDKEESAAKIVGAPDKPVLVKKFSRNVFLIKPDKRAEEMEKDPSVDEDAGVDESEDENIEEGIEEDNVDDDIIDEEENIPEDVNIDDENMEMNGDLGDEEEEEDGDDSDHDTDMMDDDEDEELNVPVVEPPPPRLGSKQKSLVKVDNFKNNSEHSFCFSAIGVSFLFHFFVCLSRSPCI